MSRLLYVFAISIILFSHSSRGGITDSKYVEKFDIKPVVFDSEKTENSTLGLDFIISGGIEKRTGSDDPDEGDEINPDVKVTGYDVSYSLKGILAENSSSNPKDFLEIRVSGNYFSSENFSWKSGFFVQHESDQNFDNEQIAYGFTATFSNFDVFSDNDSLSLYFNIGQVDPSGNEMRESILGNDLDTFDRADFEFVYIYNIGTNNLDTFEVNYRYFYEIDADGLIKESDLDRFRLITYRLGFKNNLYLAYSSGELPFNEKDNQIYEIGYNYKF